MSLRDIRRSVGQLAIVGFNGHAVPDDVRTIAREFDLAGVIFFARNVATPEVPIRTPRVSGFVLLESAPAPAPPAIASLSVDAFVCEFAEIAIAPAPLIPERSLLWSRVNLLENTPRLNTVAASEPAVLPSAFFGVGSARVTNAPRLSQADDSVRIRGVWRLCSPCDPCRYASHKTS